MKIISPGFVSFAVIDPSKAVGEIGQYKKYLTSEIDDFYSIIDLAVSNNFEVRYHYADLKNNEGGSVPVRLIITEIPPGHIQPFHIHENCYEFTVVERGEIFYAEDDSLGKENVQEIKRIGKTIKEGDMVFDDSGKRHTIANFSTMYARVITTQTPKPYSQNFTPDWK